MPNTRIRNARLFQYKLSNLILAAADHVLNTIFFSSCIHLIGPEIETVHLDTFPDALPEAFPLLNRPIRTSPARSAEAEPCAVPAFSSDVVATVHNGECDGAYVSAGLSMEPHNCGVNLVASLWRARPGSGPGLYPGHSNNTSSGDVTVSQPRLWCQSTAKGLLVRITTLPL